MILVGPTLTLAAAETILTVMSFNIRYGTAPDGDNDWEHRKTIVVEMLRAYGPDVIGTQECLEFQTEYLVQQLPEYRWFGVGRNADGGDEHAAVLYKKSVLSPLETGNFWLSETPHVPGTKSWGSHHNRMVTWARFRHLQTGETFHCFNTHLDNGSEPARQNGARILADWVQRLPRDLPLVLTGDFNAPAEASVSWNILTGQGLADAWLVAKERVGPEITFGGFKAPERTEKDRIDWVLVRGGVMVERCETSLFQMNGRFPSDHYPVVAKLVLHSHE